MIGQVEEHLLDGMKRDGTIHVTLLDPERTTASEASSISRDAESYGTWAIMVGGSTALSTSHLDKVVKAMKKTVSIPVILFPNNLTGISRFADAIWFMSLLNSFDPYFITGAQTLGAPIIRKLGLEAIPLGYVIVGEGGAVGVIGRACPIPYIKPELAASHALAAQYFGMRFVYLEAGSGTRSPVPNEMIGMVEGVVDIPLIVGGGIRTAVQAREIAKAGASIIVTGTIVEGCEGAERIGELVESIKGMRVERAH